jgi:hypothetical protein
VFNVFQNTGAEGAPTVKRAPNAIGKGAEREMNTVKFWLEPALHLSVDFPHKVLKKVWNPTSN